MVAQAFFKLMKTLFHHQQETRFCGFFAVRLHMGSCNRGFTLIEMALVMVIVGLLLTAALKGNELITNARARNVIAQQADIRAAFHGFQDRYRALPGDYPGAVASRNIPNIAADIGGDGNGVISNATANEQTIAWAHLSQAGFLSASYHMTNPTNAASEANTPRNVYNAYLQLTQDNNFATVTGATPAAARLNLKTGNAVPAEVLAEIDRKIDDGNAARGSFRFSPFNGAASAPADQDCFSLADGNWNIASSAMNCGATNLL